jgi:ribose-phosphate pyrophosphokinase
MSSLKIFSGSANLPLAQEICDYLGIPLGKVKLQRFSDGEVNFQVRENVRGMDAFVIQPTSPPVNEHLMELLIMIDALKRSSAQRITAVLPYYGYARQDRKVKPRVPISSKLVGDLLSAAGTHRLLTMDLHAGQIQGFFNMPVDHLFPTPVFLPEILRLNLEKPTVIAPDAGGVEKATVYAKRLGTTLAVIDKRRTGDNQTEVMNIVGEVEGGDVIIVDDMIDTAGTMVRAAAALRRDGARRVYAAATHAVLSGPAIELIMDSDFQSILVSNTIHLGAEQQIPKISVISVASLLGEAIKSIHEETSVSKLFV